MKRLFFYIFLKNIKILFCFCIIFVITKGILLRFQRLKVRSPAGDVEETHSLNARFRKPYQETNNVESAYGSSATFACTDTN